MRNYFSPALGNRLIKNVHILVIKGPTHNKPVSQFGSHSLGVNAPDCCWGFSTLYWCIADTSLFFLSGFQMDPAFPFVRHLLWMLLSVKHSYTETVFPSLFSSSESVKCFAPRIEDKWCLKRFSHVPRGASASFKHQVSFFFTEGILWQNDKRFLRITRPWLCWPRHVRTVWNIQGQSHTPLVAVRVGSDRLQECPGM